MTPTALRQKIHCIIDEMSEQSLQALEPLMTHLIDVDDDDNWELCDIEPVTDPEEIAMMDERFEDYKRDPSSFTPLSEIKLADR